MTKSAIETFHEFTSPHGGRKMKIHIQDNGQVKVYYEHLQDPSVASELAAGNMNPGKPPLPSGNYTVIATPHGNEYTLKVSRIRPDGRNDVHTSEHKYLADAITDAIVSVTRKTKPLNWEDTRPIVSKITTQLRERR